MELDIDRLRVIGIGLAPYFVGGFIFGAILATRRVATAIAATALLVLVYVLGTVLFTYDWLRGAR